MSLLSHLQAITRFEIPGITEKKKTDYLTMLYRICADYERLDGALFNQFNNLPEIVVTNDIERVRQYCGMDALGCAYPYNIAARTGKGIITYYFDSYLYESIVVSMELAHWAYQDVDFQKAWSDVIHYAANVMAPPYIKNGVCRIWGYSRAEKIKNAVLRRPIREIPLLLYNMPYLAREKDRIMAEIRSGTAPKGKNPYWSTGLSPVPSVRLPAKLQEFLGHYDHDH